MRRPPRPLLIALMAAVGIGLFSCARRMTQRRPLSAPVSGSASEPGAAAPRIAAGPRMDHEKHLGKGLECADCHMHGEDPPGKEPKPVTYAACADCHDDEDKALPEEKRVKNVFFKADGAPAWESAFLPYDPEVKWSHAAHGKAACADCHKDLGAAPRTVKQPFTMDGCMACHAQKAAPNTCATCHKVLRDDVKPPSHDAAWRRAHGPAAMAKKERCETCHRDPASCDACHQRTPPASHGQASWMSAHGPAAVARQERCEMCHTDPAACVRCHVVTKPLSHDRLWMERHGAVALDRRSRTEGRCELCHLDPNFCERCHAVVEPRNHTHLFRTKTHGIVAAVDRAKCQVCHDTDFCVRCHESTPPRSHGAMWASGRNLHCAQCHIPIRFSTSCRACHFEEPTHSTAPPQPAWHTPGMNCRLCHTPAGNGAPPLRHIDNGTQCETCHR